MNVSWQPTKLAKILTPVSRAEAVDPTKEYPLLGVRLEGRGPFLRETVMGSQSAATRLFKVQLGDFIYSRLFAWRGAFGVIEPELNGCYVSGEFPTFRPVPGEIDANFLRLWFCLPSTIERVEADCTGSTPLTRNRFKENFFLNLAIPLPPLSEQRRIVARIEALAAKIDEARNLREEVQKDLSRLLNAAYHQTVDTAPTKPLGELAPLDRRPVTVDFEASYPQVAVHSFGRGTFHKPPLIGSEVSWEKPFLVKAGDILVSNIKAWEGAIAVAGANDDGRVGSHRYLTCVATPGLATARFVCFHLLTSKGLYEVGEASPGSADRNRTLNAKAFMRIPVPMPEYRKQLWFDALYQKVNSIAETQSESAPELAALLPSILDKAFKGEL